MSQNQVRVPSYVPFITGTAAVTLTGMGAASTLAAVTNSERWADLSGALEGRIVVRVTTGQASTKLRIQYSTDGTNWYDLFRRIESATASGVVTNWAQPLFAEATVEVSTAAAGLVKSIWGPMYPDALTDVQLRLWGGGGTAPAASYVVLEVK